MFFLSLFFIISCWVRCAKTVEKKKDAERIERNERKRERKNGLRFLLYSPNAPILIWQEGASYHSIKVYWCRYRDWPPCLSYFLSFLHSMGSNFDAKADSSLCFFGSYGWHCTFFKIGVSIPSKKYDLKRSDRSFLDEILFFHHCNILGPIDHNVVVKREETDVSNNVNG